MICEKEHVQREVAARTRIFRSEATTSVALRPKMSARVESHNEITRSPHSIAVSMIPDSIEEKPMRVR